MLIIDRKAKPNKDLLWVGTSLVRVLGVDKQSGVVKLGIEADKDVKVLRGELTPHCATEGAGS